MCQFFSHYKGMAAAVKKKIIIKSKKRFSAVHWDYTVRNKEIRDRN